MELNVSPVNTNVKLALMEIVVLNVRTELMVKISKEFSIMVNVFVMLTIENQMILKIYNVT